MPVKTEWYDDTGTIAHCQVSTGWSLQEVRSAIDHLAKLCENNRYCVNVLIEMQSLQQRPLNLLSMARYAEKKLQRYTGMIVICGAPTYIKALTRVAEHFAPRLTQRITFVDSVPEAEALLESTESDIHVA